MLSKGTVEENLPPKGQGVEQIIRLLEVLNMAMKSHVTDT